ncbi:hypothetical protein K440DRAFT_630086 [Wilcoxina mikolae CBS 423.85]|nr:hypothetical protein K440DRAFT_630086 [Wilcoxina mikolae CBS 423.85]
MGSLFPDRDTCGLGEDSPSMERYYSRLDFLQLQSQHSVQRELYRKSVIGTKRHVCQTCGADFSTHTNLNRHKSTWKCGGNSQLYNCAFCKRKYNRKDNLDKHLRKGHYCAAPGAAAGRTGGNSLLYVSRG